MSRVLSLANYTGGVLSTKLSDSTKVLDSKSADIAPSHYPLDAGGWALVDTTGFDKLELSNGKYKLTIDPTAIRFDNSGNYWSTVGMLKDGQRVLIDKSGEQLNVNAIEATTRANKDAHGYFLEKDSSMSTVFMWLFVVLYFILLAVIAVATVLSAHYLKRRG